MPLTELALVIIGDVLFGVDLWADAAEMARDAQATLACIRATLQRQRPVSGPAPVEPATG